MGRIKDLVIEEESEDQFLRWLLDCDKCREMLDNMPPMHPEDMTEGEKNG